MIGHQKFGFIAMSISSVSDFLPVQDLAQHDVAIAQDRLRGSIDTFQTVASAKNPTSLHRAACRAATMLYSQLEHLTVGCELDEGAKLHPEKGQPRSIAAAAQRNIGKLSWILHPDRHDPCAQKMVRDIAKRLRKAPSWQDVKNVWSPGTWLTDMQAERTQFDRGYVLVAQTLTTPGNPEADRQRTETAAERQRIRGMRLYARLTAAETIHDPDSDETDSSESEGSASSSRRSSYANSDTTEDWRQRFRASATETILAADGVEGEYGGAEQTGNDAVPFEYRNFFGPF